MKIKLFIKIISLSVLTFSFLFLLSSPKVALAADDCTDFCHNCGGGQATCDGSWGEDLGWTNCDEACQAGGGSEGDCCTWGPNGNWSCHCNGGGGDDDDDGGGCAPQTCLSGTCTGASAGNAGDCAARAGTWTPTCCDYANYASTTYNPACGYCSASCNSGQCQYDAGSGNWQWTSCYIQACPPTSPTNLLASCPSPGSSATVSWDAVAGATTYQLRVDDTSNGWKNDCGVEQFPGDICINNLTTTSYTFTTTPGNAYSWWIHASNSGGMSSASYGPNFTCVLPKGTILGRVANQAKIDAGIADNLIENPEIVGCDTNVNEVRDVSINFSGTSTATTTPGVCIDSLPAYSQSLIAGTYTVTANVPVGWEAKGWTCNPNDPLDTRACPAASGDGGGVSGVNLTSDKFVHIWFYIQPIPPTCTINGDTSIVAGETGVWTTTTTVSSPGGDANAQIMRNSVPNKTIVTLPTGTPLLVDGNGETVSNLYGYARQSNECNGSSTCIINRQWSTTLADVGSHYVFCRGWNDALRQCRPFDYGSYPEDVDCSGDIVDPTTVGVCPDDDCKIVTVTNPGPWFQTQGGDVHAQSTLQSYIPSTIAASNQFFNLNLDTYPGLISLSPLPNTFDFYSGSDDTKSLLRSSTKKWLAGSSFTPFLGTTPYAYFYQKLGSPTTINFPCVPGTTPCNLPKPSAGTYIYYADSTVQIPNSGWKIPNNVKIIVFVTKDLQINGNIEVPVGSFLVFIVNGNINIHGGVGTKDLALIGVFPSTASPHVQGVYLTNGLIDTYYNKQDDLNNGIGNAWGSGFKLATAGIFYGKTGVNLPRDLKADDTTMNNTNTPAETFIFRPDLVVNAPYELWSSKMDWQEVAP